MTDYDALCELLEGNVKNRDEARRIWEAMRENSRMMHASIIRLHGELEEAEQNAARYLWLRDSCNATMWEELMQINSDEWNSTIDAARAAGSTRTRI